MTEDSRSALRSHFVNYPDATLGRIHIQTTSKNSNRETER